MRIYLASRYSRREELCGYRTQLESIGHTVTARWLNGLHQINDAGVPVADDGMTKLVRDEDESTEVKVISMRAKFAREDYDDVMSADMLIAFTEKPRSELTRGGRHVELGVAIGAGKIVIVVGPRENIFCWMDTVLHFDNWSDCYNVLATSRLIATTGSGDFLMMPKQNQDYVQKLRDQTAKQLAERNSPVVNSPSLSPHRVGPNDYTARPSKTPIAEQPMLMSEESQASLDGFLSHPIPRRRLEEDEFDIDWPDGNDND